MNYGDLKTAILADTHRPDLSAHVERFVRQCEGLIRRDLKAYLLHETITDSDRVYAGGGLYNIPARCLEIRQVTLQGRQGDALQRVAPGVIERLDTTAPVVQYVELGNNTIDFQGVPGSNDIFDILYYGTPAPFASDSDENDLLTDHETLYMAGSKFYLYLHTQDRELASDELDIYNGVIDTLNEQIARKIGGANVAPSYNFAGGSSY